MYFILFSREALSSLPSRENRHCYCLSDDIHLYRKYLNESGFHIFYNVLYDMEY